MTKLYKALLERKEYLEQILKSMMTAIESAPKERLRITHTGKSRSYYLNSPEIRKRNKSGMYLKKSELGYAEKIAQRDYYNELSKDVIIQLKSINQLLLTLDNNTIQKSYDKQNKYRKELIKPIEISDKDYLEEWLHQEYKGLPFNEEDSEIYTEKEERVRSKSEKIIADFLYKHNIPYLYEKPLLIMKPDGKLITLYPDFTILDIDNREEIYLEHLGMMDNMEYVKKALNKLTTYITSGLLLGERLLLSYETSKTAVDTKILEATLSKYYKDCIGGNEYV